MWQFMTYTAPEFNLTRNGYFDYRFDPEKSTRAYARYMKQLYGLLGDWYLAMAAYDWGPGNIQRVVSRLGTPTSGSSIAKTRCLPRPAPMCRRFSPPSSWRRTGEIRPQQAATSPPVIYETVAVDYAISLNLVADVTDATVPEIVALNPAMMRLSTPSDISYACTFRRAHRSCQSHPKTFPKTSAQAALPCCSRRRNA